MAYGRKVLEIDMRGRKARSRHEALLESLGSSPAGALERLVSLAMSHFEGGSDPNSVYTDFDIEGFAQTLALDRRSAAAALGAFVERTAEEKIAACMFVSMAIITVDGADPALSRMMLGHILRRASHDAEFSDLSKIVLMGIAETVSGMKDMADSSLVSLAASCMKRLTQ
ncbi:MAG TPA: hypothetical protein VLD37_00980 [Candidatus Bilamarchaeum sp.]|nr:hypothetical protein [Candidatus Bilamarchaeum sp.]